VIQSAKKIKVILKWNIAVILRTCYGPVDWDSKPNRRKEFLSFYIRGYLLQKSERYTSTPLACLHGSSTKGTL
jgi:hypothetical protein